MDKFLDEAARVRTASIPEEKHVAAEVEQQVAEEVANLLLLDVFEVKMEVKVEPPTLGTDGDPRDHRDTITPVVMTQHRGLPDRRPAPGDRGGQEEA